MEILKKTLKVVSDSLDEIDKLIESEEKNGFELFEKRIKNYTISIYEAKLVFVKNRCCR